MSAYDPPPFACSICTRQLGLALCPACVRAALLPHRASFAYQLLEIRHLAQHAQVVVDTGAGETRMLDAQTDRDFLHARGASTALITSKKQDQGTLIQDRIVQLRARAKAIQELIHSRRRQLGDQRRKLNDRQRALDTSRSGIRLSHVRGSDTLKKQIRKATLRLDFADNQIPPARLYLCREAAALAGLTQKIRKSEHGDPMLLYYIGQTRLLDLRELNSATPQHITTMLGNIVRLLALVCHYHHIRLPSEIILPYQSHPLPMINMPHCSYRTRLESAESLRSTSHSFRGSLRSTGSSASGFAGQRRPLFLDHRKISVLAKEDSAAFAAFVEGISLLAWNVIWLCRSQGVQIGASDWEDFMSIGRNLWIMLVATPEEQSNSIRRSQHRASKRHTGSPPNSELPMTPPRHAIGTYSHGSARHFLGRSQGFGAPSHLVEASNWRFWSPATLVECVRMHLLSEMSGAEWEMVREDDYSDAGSKVDETPIVVNGRGHTRRVAAAPLVSSNTSSVSAAQTDVEQAAPKTGHSGWTKLRSRSSAH